MHVHLPTHVFSLTVFASPRLRIRLQVRKRDKWLDKAKDIIKEYQKRHSPGTPGR